MDDSLVNMALDSLRGVQRTFTLSDYSQECFHDRSDANLKRSAELLRWLFFAGAIGNVRHGARESYLQFYHRREQAGIYLKGKFVRHTALNYASGEPW